MISDQKQLTLTATVDESTIEAEVSVSIGLIVTELVINALKHAFPGHHRTGAIAVDYNSDGKAWTLSVGVNGIGIPKVGTARPGLGTGIVDALSKQLRAEVTIAAANPGTKVSISHAGGATAAP
jgi:two-component sensor histidine kinase